MIRIMYLMIIILSVSSCISTNKLVYFQSKKFSKTTPTLIENKRVEYRIQPNDVLSVRVTNSLDKTAPNIFESEGQTGGGVNPAALFYITGYSVDERGMINYPNLGKLKVQNLTINEARDLIQQQVDKYMTNANVIVRLVSFKLTILGDVRNPGYHFVYNNQATLPEALGLAGDLTYNGNRKNIKLIRQSTSGVEVVLLDLTDPNLIKSPYFYLQPNDMIYVQPLRAQLSRTNLSLMGTVFGAISATFLILSYFGVGK
jgi:polysaccharide biosynthesis/export protein